MAASRQWTLLKDFLRKTYNKDVLEWFADLDPDDETFDTPRKSAKANALIKPADGQNISLIKMINFYMNIVQAHRRPDIYGIPVDTYHESIRFLPQIVIHWRERNDIAKANNRYPIRARLAIRYKGSIDSQTEVETLANKVARIFATGTAHHWTKGRISFFYQDKEKSHQFRLFAQNENDARDCINKMLEITDDNPLNEELLTTATVDRNWNEIDYIRVAGDNYKKPQFRPVGEIYFSHAELKVHGMPKDKILVNQLNEVVSLSYR